MHSGCIAYNGIRYLLFVSILRSYNSDYASLVSHASYIMTSYAFV